MKSLIVYDSLYGNTEKVAEAVGSVFGKSGKVLHLDGVNVSDLKDQDLLIVGSPTHGGMPTPALQAFLKKIPANSLKGVRVAAFDTRFAAEEQGIGLRLLMKIINFAAPRIAKSLTSKGGILVADPEGFIVEEKSGPLKKGELKRAADWAQNISKKVNA